MKWQKISLTPELRDLPLVPLAVMHSQITAHYRGVRLRHATAATDVEMKIEKIIKQAAEVTSVDFSINIQ